VPTATSTASSCAPARARVELCGTLVAEIGGRRVDAALPGRKGRLLFACLVIERAHTLGRDALIGVVWPHEAPVDPEGAFSTLLTRVRAALGPGVVVGRGELRLELGAGAHVDWDLVRAAVQAAEAGLATRDPRAMLELAEPALAIARRPLLPGMSATWLEDRRRQLLAWRAALLEAQGRAALILGGPQLAIAESSAHDLIMLEPYRESAHALLMETHTARGNVAEALRAFDALRTRLREDLGLCPSPPLAALAGRLLETDGRAPAPTPVPPHIAAQAARPLAGRVREVRALLEHVTADVPGGRVLAITGESGIGKSRVAAEVAMLAHARGRQVLSGTAQRDSLTPYQPFVDALRRPLACADAAAALQLTDRLGPELAELATILPELRPVAGRPADRGDEEARRRRLVGGVTGILEAMAARRPMVLVLEDVQWADASTIALLEHVVRALASQPAAILLTIADDEPLPARLRTLLVDLCRQRALVREELRPLDETEIAALLAAHLQDEPDRRTIRRISTDAGGNPFFAEELIGTGRPAGVLTPGLRDAVALRVDRLPERARGLLRAAAAAGPQFDVATVARHAEAPPAVTRDAIREAVDFGLVVTAGKRSERFAFRHGLVRRALLAS
jgi:DNA-binding SARP family transcriptional activator